VEPISILICDDHAHFRDGLRALLETSSEVEVVGEAPDGAAAVEASLALQPDVVLMDLTMPGMGGVEATRQLLAACPHIGVLVLSMVADDDSVFAALQAGARGYLLKGARKAEILRAVRAVASGEAIFDAAIASRLINYFATPPPAATPFPQLTSREVEILRLLTEHLTNPEIADRLGLTTKTVRNHVSNIFSKLQVASRAEAISTARQAGLGP
jgi:DNA-binding NarL/FixJ family response regulator